MNTATQTPVYLPRELWYKILRNFDTNNDLPELWMAYRYVNTTFRNAVESIFIENYLPKTWLLWRLGGINSRKYGDTTLATEFKFKTLSEDKTDAIFEGNVFDEAYRTVIRSRLEERIADISHDTITDPHQHVQIGRDLNDTPVPGLTLNPNNFELSLNWREMYTRFYGEEMLYHQKLHDWVISKEIWTKGLAAKTERGEMDELDAFSLTLNAFGDASHESRKDARRARIKRQFREVGYEWDFEDSYNLCDEERILEGLKKSIQMASMADESDDEDASVEEASNSEETRQDTNNDDMENVGEEEE